MPMTLGTTRRTAPETPDLAGKPTWRGGRSTSVETCAQHDEPGLSTLTWKANSPEKSYMPQECMRLRVFRTASVLSTRSPVVGQMPPLASVAAMALPDSQVTSMEHSWRWRRAGEDEENLKFIFCAK